MCKLYYVDTCNVFPPVCISFSLVYTSFVHISRLKNVLVVWLSPSACILCVLGNRMEKFPPRPALCIGQNRSGIKIYNEENVIKTKGFSQLHDNRSLVSLIQSIIEHLYKSYERKTTNDGYFPN